MNLEDTLKNISDLVAGDTNLTAELRDQVADLIEEVHMDPTPANMRVLATVLEKLSDATKYIGALRTLSSFEGQPVTT